MATSTSATANTPEIQKSQEIVRQYLESTDAATIDANTHSYSCRVHVVVAGGGFLAVDFAKNGKDFAQFTGGFALGAVAYTGWGTAWFNTPVEGLIGKAGAFTVEVVGVIGGTGHVQITGDGFIGNCSTGGFGIGASVGVGGGSFKARG